MITELTDWDLERRTAMCVRVLNDPTSTDVSFHRASRLVWILWNEADRRDGFE